MYAVNSCTEIAPFADVSTSMKRRR